LWWWKFPITLLQYVVVGDSHGFVYLQFFSFWKFYVLGKFCTQSGWNWMFANSFAHFLYGDLRKTHLWFIFIKMNVFLHFVIYLSAYSEKLQGSKKWGDRMETKHEIEWLMSFSNWLAKDQKEYFNEPDRMWCYPKSLHLLKYVSLNPQRQFQLSRMVVITRPLINCKRKSLFSP
jgi:hypothetical protein